MDLKQSYSSQCVVNDVTFADLHTDVTSQSFVVCGYSLNESETVV